MNFLEITLICLVSFLSFISLFLFLNLRDYCQDYWRYRNKYTSLVKSLSKERRSIEVYRNSRVDGGAESLLGECKKIFKKGLTSKLQYILL